MNKKTRFPNTRWHRILASVLQKWLTPVGLTVQSDVALTTDPQEADILIIKHESKLTPEQHYRLADGIRDSKAQYCLLEFKYTESLNDCAIIQLLSYGEAYKKGQNLKKSEVDLFLLVSKTPQQKTLARMGYNVTANSGVYHSQYALFATVVLLSLNDLSNKPQNIPLKCFASKKSERQIAFNAIQHRYLKGVEKELEWVFAGLRELMLIRGDQMNIHETEELTPEFVENYGKEMIDHLISIGLEGLSSEERMKGVPIKERLKGVPVEERMKGVPAEERMKGVPVEERLEGLSNEELLQLKEKLNKL